MKSKKLVWGLLIFPFFLAACGGEHESSENTRPAFSLEDEIVTVETAVTVAEKRNRLISLSGTVVAEEEITIAAEASGVVSKIEKEEGEDIEEGDIIMILEANSNLLQASYQAAQAAFSNASAVLSLTKDSAAQDTENAAISLEQAKISYRKVKNSSKYISQSSEASRLSAEKSVEIAQKNVEIAKEVLAQTMENEEKIQKNLLENTSNTLSKVLVDFRSSLTFTDDLIGASDLKRNDNDSFEVYLVGTSQGILIPTQDLWLEASRELSVVESNFRLFEKTSYTKEDEEKILEMLDDTLKSAKSVRMVLRNLESMLLESIPSQVFTQTSIDTYRSQVTTYQSSLEANIASLTAMSQSLSDYHIQSPQRIVNAEMSLSVAESQLASSQDSLSNISSNDSLSGVNLNADLEAAKQSLRAAETAFLSAKTRSALSVQTAKSQFDSAKSALDQASISLSKLVVRSGKKGTVSEVLRHDGDTVSPGTPLAIVSDFSSLKLLGDISLEESFFVKEGTQAVVTIEGIDKKIDGIVSQVSPQADKVTRRVEIEITIPNAEKIPANIFALAEIQISAEQEKVYIPKNSVVDGYVFVLQEDENGKVLEKRKVDGAYIGGDFEVFSGLLPGKTIVVSSVKNLEDGQKIEEKK